MSLVPFFSINSVAAEMLSVLLKNRVPCRLKFSKNLPCRCCLKYVPCRVVPLDDVQTNIVCSVYVILVIFQLDLVILSEKGVFSGGEL